MRSPLNSTPTSSRVCSASSRTVVRTRRAPSSTRLRTSPRSSRTSPISVRRVAVPSLIAATRSTLMLPSSSSKRLPFCRVRRPFSRMSSSWCIRAAWLLRTTACTLYPGQTKRFQAAHKK
eukprot:804542-Prorocentrum_minimum.AAC.3